MKIILPFKDRFVPLVLAGTKTTTIRKVRKVMPEAGWMIDAVTAFRTPKQRTFFAARITAICRCYWLNGFLMADNAAEDFETTARLDGFSSSHELREFMIALYGEAELEQMKLYRISWEFSEITGDYKND